MSGKNRIKITQGMQVLIAMKKDQRAGKTTKGAVKDILTKSQTHPHWIKVRMAQPRNNRFICHLRKMMIIYLHFNQGLAAVHNSFAPGALQMNAPNPCNFRADTSMLYTGGKKWESQETPKRM